MKSIRSSGRQRTGHVLTALAVLAFIAAPAAGCGGDEGAETPEAAAEAFFTAAADEDFNAACENATDSPGSTGELDCEGFAETIQYTPLDEATGFKTVKEEGSEATVSVTTASGASFQVGMVDDGGWKVDQVDVGS